MQSSRPAHTLSAFQRRGPAGSRMSVACDAYLLLTCSLIADIAYGKITVPVSLDVTIRNAGRTRLTGYSDGVVNVLAKVLVLALKRMLLSVRLNQIVLIGGPLQAPGQCVVPSRRTTG